MISIMSTSRADDRRYYARFRAFRGCSILHDKTNLTACSRFAPGVALRAREANRARDHFYAGTRAMARVRRLHDLIVCQAEVFKRLHAVLAAAEVLAFGARDDDAPMGRVTVDREALAALALLAQQAQVEAQQQQLRVEQLGEVAP